MVRFPIDHKIFLYDSFYKNNGHHHIKYSHMICLFLNDLHNYFKIVDGKGSDWLFYYGTDKKLQYDSFECGVYCCMFAYNIVMQRNTEFFDFVEKVSFIRKRLVLLFYSLWRSKKDQV